MADEVCPLCEGQGSGLPGYFGTMADMFTLLFAFFVLMFSMATMDPAKLSDAGGDDVGSAKETEEMVEEIKEEVEDMKEMGITEINGQPIEEYMDSVVQEIEKSIEPPPKLYEVEGEMAEIIEAMELDSSTNMIRDVRGTSFEINGNICFDVLSARMKPTLIDFLDAAADSFMMVPSDKRQIIVEGHTDNMPIPPKRRKKYESNWELSAARAATVVKYLVDKGVNPARLVAHGYADRWPADMAWRDMRRGGVDKPAGDVEVVEGRGGQKQYSGGGGGRQPIDLEKVGMEVIIDSLNSTPKLQAKNRRIKIIFTHQNFVDGNEPFGSPK